MAEQAKEKSKHEENITCNFKKKIQKQKQTQTNKQLNSMTSIHKLMQYKEA
jgi:hypothetical protein